MNPHIRNTAFTVACILEVTTSSCSFNFELTSQRTALENQIMGSYKELDDDLIVTNYDQRPRGSTNGAGDKKLQSADASKATRNRQFNADDINELKESAILGESQDGRLARLPKGTVGISEATIEQIKLAEALLDEENRDRVTLWRSYISQNQSLSEKDLPAIQEAFARKQYESSPKGHWFFTGSKWSPKQ